ncbi:MAG TPA: hypothetical protein VFI65_00430 [Streptosporangiaceae bacterium]|nr:hypothetical protein [Streptosporangiaceae bacterium]
MHKRPFGEKHFSWISLMPVPCNASVSVPELGSCNRQSINKQGQINSSLGFPNAIAQLASKSQHISPILGKSVRRQRVPRPKVSKVNLHPSIPNPLPQHIQRTPCVNLSGDPLRKLPLRRLRIPVQPNKAFPALRLCGPNKSKNLPSINPKPSTKRILPPLPPPTKQLLLKPNIKG